MTAYNPMSFAAAGWRHKELIFQLARRRVESRYRGSVLGLSWALLEPLVMLAIYTFVFSFVFKARWGSLPDDTGQFSLLLFSGLTIYTVFAEAVNEAPHEILNSSVFVKQLVFPVEILAWVSLLAGLWKFLLSSALLVLFYRLTQGNLPIAALFLPMIMLPVVLLTLGITWLVSSLGVFLRDLGQVVGLATTGLLFLSPIFYPASMIPERFHGLYFLNPFAGILEMSKQSLFAGRAPDPVQLTILVAIGWGVAWLGFAWFSRTKSSFADVL